MENHTSMLYGEGVVRLATGVVGALLVETVIPSLGDAVIIMTCGIIHSTR